MEDRPLDPAAASLAGDLDHFAKQGFADAPAAVLGIDDDVIQIKTGLGQKRGIIMEE